LVIGTEYIRKYETNYHTITAIGRNLIYIL
jgi:hypothetical protein